MFPSSSSESTRHLVKMNFTFRSIVLCVAYFTCCICAWPAVAPSNYRRSSINANSNNYVPYAPSNVLYEPDYQQDNYNMYNNQWDRAREPEQLSYYDLVDDYWANAPVSSSANDDEGFSQFADLYDPPVWGQIVKEKPENELEELKAEERQKEAEAEQRRALEEQYKYYAYDMGSRQDKRQSPSAQFETKGISATVAPIGQTQSPVISTTLSSSSNSKTTASAPSPKPVRLLHQQPGQKEVPLLRPPNKNKMMNEHANSEPVIAVAQRSVVEKPSAYDTLRKYLSLEDALKKEADKRKRSMNNRIQKRAPMDKKIISDTDSLSGQLHSLKKSLV